MEINMKIVIRPGLMDPTQIVVQPMEDNYQETLPILKGNLKNIGEYEVFKQIIASEVPVIEEAIERLNARSPAAIDERRINFDAINFEYLSDILSLVVRMKSGDKSITIEDYIANPRGGRKNERKPLALVGEVTPPARGLLP